jgi:YoeB-like toxin of bacterial type II toxin-antitoxin system
LTTGEHGSSFITSYGKRQWGKTAEDESGAVFTPHSWEDYTYRLSADRMLLKRINRLIEDALRDPATGIGKPERSATCWLASGCGGLARITGWSTSLTSSFCKLDSITSNRAHCRLAGADSGVPR